MRHWARVTTIVLVTSACNDEVPPAAPPTTAAVPGPVADAGDRERKGIEPAPHPEGDDDDDDDGGIGLFTKRRVIPPSPPREGGLFGLTRELIETARRTEGEPMRLVPDAAQFVVRARPAALLAHPELQAVWTKAEESNPSIKTAMEVVRTCLGRVEAIDDVVLGFDDAKHLVLAARAKGLGTAPTWLCLQTETVARGRPFELSLTGTHRGKGPQLRGDDGNLGYFPDDDTVVLVSKEWDADVQARLRAEGTAAIEGSLAAVMRRIQPDDPLWMAGRITGLPERGLASTAMAGIDDVAFGLRITGDDLLLATSVDAGEAADATRVRDELQRQFEEIRSVLPMVGVPPSVPSKLVFVAEGELVKLDLTLAGHELRSIRESIERMF